MIGIPARPAQAQSTIWAEWTRQSETLASFTFPGDVNAGTVEVVTTGCSNTTHVSEQRFGSIAHGHIDPITGNPWPNYPDTWYTPPPPDPTDFFGLNAGGDCVDNAVVATLTIAFDEPVTDPVLHFINLDAGEYRFLDGIAVTRLSGNDQFEVVGTHVNTPPVLPGSVINPGCQANDGDSPSGGCGSVRVDGTVTQLLVEVTDNQPDPDDGDGHLWTVSIEAEPVPSLPGVALVLLVVLLAASALWWLRRARASEGPVA